MTFTEKCLALASLSLLPVALPVALPAAYIPVDSGCLCGTDPLPEQFLNDFIAYQTFSFEFRLAPNPQQGGFSSLAGVGYGTIEIFGMGIELVSHSDPQAAENVFFEYSASEPQIGFAGLARQEGEDPDVLVVINFGTFYFLRFEADAYPAVGQTMRLSMAFSLGDDIAPDEPLAVDFHNELMAFTGGTGMLWLEAVVTVEEDYSFTVGDAQLLAIPEPGATAAALGAGVLALALLRRRLRRA